VIRFVHLLARRGDINLIEDVIRQVRSIVPALDEQSNVLVKSAKELDQKEKKKLEEKLRHEHGEELQFRYEVEAALLGGLRIHIGDQVIDHSVAARLDALRERLVG
jgi:F-type H+-transporting ATPase subunit delta